MLKKSEPNSIKVGAWRAKLLTPADKIEYERKLKEGTLPWFHRPGEYLCPYEYQSIFQNQL